MNKNNRGFALTGAIMAWLVGITALLGGGAYTANQMFNDDMMDDEYSYSIGGDKDHSFIPTYDEIKNAPMGVLSESERTGLITMREEEKLARDVYRTMFDTWGVKVFDNISYSEERHMQAVKVLLDKYSIDDPVIDDTTGVFTIPAIQTMYDDFVAQGSESVVAALNVGATIEDFDVYDLDRWIADTDNEDIKLVYENLQRASRNHMRSFAKQLANNGSEYTAQYLTQSEIDTIINSDKERGDGHEEMGESREHNKGGRSDSWMFDDLDDLDSEYGPRDDMWDDDLEIDDMDDDSYREDRRGDRDDRDGEHKRKGMWR